MLRSLGFTRRQVRSAVRWQAGTLTAAALCLGVPAGILCGRIAWRAFAGQLGILPVPVVPLAALAVLVPAALALVVAVAAVPGESAAGRGPPRSCAASSASCCSQSSALAGRAVCWARGCPLHRDLRQLAAHGAHVLVNICYVDHGGATHPITVFLADDNLIVREGVRALISLEHDFSVVGTAADYDELVSRASELAPQVVVTDIRMPPSFQQEGIEAAHEIRKRHPGTGIVVLSQFDDPEYAISLLAEGSAGYAYLLKDRVAEGDQLARAVRAVATGGSVLDPAIVEAMVHPVTRQGELSPAEEELLQLVAEGRPIKAIAVAQGHASAAADAVERLFVRMAEDASSGGNSVRCGACACFTRPSSTGRSRARP